MLFHLFVGCVGVLTVSSKYNVTFASFLSITTAPPFNCTQLLHTSLLHRREGQDSFVTPQLDWLWGPPVWLILVVEWLVSDIDHVLIFGTEVKNAWDCTAPLKYIFMT